MVQGAVSKKEINRPSFLGNKNVTERLTKGFSTTMRFKISKVPKRNLYDQDGATPHCSTLGSQYLDEKYPKRRIGRADPFHGVIADWLRHPVNTLQGSICDRKTGSGPLR